MFILLVPANSFANEEEYDYYPGLLFGQPFKHTRTGDDLNFNITDGDNETSNRITQTGYYYIEFDEPIDIKSYYRESAVGGGTHNPITFVLDNGELVTVGGVARVYYADIDVSNVVEIRLRSNAASGWYVTWYSFEVYGEPTAEPSIPTGLKAVGDVGKVTLTWNVQAVRGFNVYRNGEKLNSELVVGTEFVDITGDPEVTYAYQISAVNSFGRESIKSNVVYAYSLLELIKPTVTYKNLTDTSVRLEWDRVGNRYSVYQDGLSLVENRSYPFLDVGKLTPNTDYEFYVRSVDRFGRYIDSDVLTIRTHSLALRPPVVSLTEVKHDSFILTWQNVEGADRYEVYLDGVRQTESVSPITFTGLSPETIYTVRVDAINSDETVSTSRSTTTARSPVPRIDFASVSPSTGGSPTSRNLQYQPNDLVSAVKIYINGKLVGEFPADQREIEIDFADIQDALMADITIEPVDENGEPYNLKTPIQSTENGLIDQIIGNLLDAFNISKKAFMYIAIWSVVFLLLIVVLFFWLRKKFKRMLGGAKLNKQQHRRQAKKFTDGHRGSTEDRYFAGKDRYGNKSIRNSSSGGGTRFNGKANMRTRAPTQNQGRTPKKDFVEKDKRYYQSFGNQEFKSKVVNFNDQSNVIAFQNRVSQITNNRRNRK